MENMLWIIFIFMEYIEKRKWWSGMGRIMCGVMVDNIRKGEFEDWCDN